MSFPSDEERGDDDDQPTLLDSPAEPLPPQGGATRQQLFVALAQPIRAHLQTRVEEVRKVKEQKLEIYAATKQPQFLPYVDKAKENLDRLGAHPTNRDIELALYEAKYDGREEMDKLACRIIGTSEAHQMVDELAQALIEQYTRDVSKANVSALADFVCTRRAVLTVLKELQRKDGDSDKENYYERAIHNLFFPRFNASDRLACGPLDHRDREIAHLWLIDERLVFHKLLASDVAPSRLRRLLSDSNEPPDIVVFDPAFPASDNLTDLNSLQFP